MRSAYLALASLMVMVLFVPIVPAQNGPEIDVLRYLVIRDPTAQLMAALNCDIDVLTQRTRPADIMALWSAGFTITSTPGFHICFIGFNIRADQSYRRPEITFWPLSDVDFRHALAHSLNKTGMVAALGGWVKLPLNSMVPPIYGKWHNPSVGGHPFNLGNPFTSPPSAHDSCGILRAAGYTFVDADVSGTVTDADYWKMPNGSPLPQMDVFSPLYEVDPQKYMMVHIWLQDCRSIGFVGTTANGNRGLVQLPGQFWDYTQDAYDAGPPAADFDIFIVNFKLNRFPDYLYDWFHSSQDSLSSPSAYNPFGLNDPVLDGLLETLKFSLDHGAKVQACQTAQQWLADSANLQGLPVLPVYTTYYFDAFNPNLQGIVQSPGYGAGDGGCVALREPDGPSPSVWTYTNIRWAAGEPADVNWCLSDSPETLNPLYAGTTLAWEIMDRVFDPLITVNPYNHHDVPWIATDWEVALTPIGMNVTYFLRDDVFWQDGYPYDASCAEFSLEFVRDWQINKYKPAWEPILDVEVINPTTFRVVSTETSQFLIYDWSVLATLLPRQIWDRPWSSLAALLAYRPETFVYGTDMAPGYTSGPTPPPANLFGTGPWIYQFYDATNEYYELWANRQYFMTTQEIRDLKTYMFWEVGDVGGHPTKNPPGTGIVNVIDLTFVGLRYGSQVGGPNYDPAADFNSDGWIDMIDVSIVAYHLLWQKEYP